MSNVFFSTLNQLELNCGEWMLHHVSKNAEPFSVSYPSGYLSIFFIKDLLVSFISNCPKKRH